MSLRITEKKALYCSFALYVAIIVILAAATVIESSKGTDFVTGNIYHAWWFIALWATLAICSVAALIKGRMWRKPHICLMHTALLLILSGAFVTHIWGEQGMMHIREGKKSDMFVDTDGATHRMPFDVELSRFRIIHYDGTTTPAGYESKVVINNIDHTISMNHIASVEGYRLYQTSYDEDCRGTILSVNHDPVGIAITYTGYAMLLLSFILMFLLPDSGFRKTVATLTIVIMVATRVGATPVIPHDEAMTLREKAVVYNNRIAPFNTAATEFMLKLYGKSEYNSLTAEQVLGSVIVYPEEWLDEPILRIRERCLRDSLGINGEYASIRSLYDTTGYRLQHLKDANRDNTALLKAITNLDEKVAIVAMAQQGKLFRPAVTASADRMHAEVVYNSLPMASAMFKINLTAGLLALIAFIIQITLGKADKGLRIAALLLNLISCIIIASHHALRWYITRHIPMSNGYETMVSIALMANVVALIAGRRSTWGCISGLIVSGAALMVASFSSTNPQITPLMPVLASPWLSLHVTCMVISYSLCATMAITGVAALFTDRSELHTMSRIMLYPAIAFMGTGVFLGAIWANVSWGRYWGWDPKEVWALISLMIYAVPAHGWFSKVLASRRAYHIYIIVAFAAIIMTYFGVNNLLGGMHSYR